MTTPASNAIPAPTAAKPATPLKTGSSAKAASAPEPAAPAKPRARRAPAKVAAKSVPATAKAAPAKPVVPKPPVSDKNAKMKKPKLVRDSFTIPKDEYAAIEVLKQRAAALAQPIKKSELLRAGLKVLAGMSDAALRNALQAVPLLKTGRPKAEPATPVTAPKSGTKSAGKK